MDQEVDNINEGIVSVVRKVLTTKYGDEENNAVIPIDEAIKEMSEDKSDADNRENKKIGDSINNKRNIMDFLGDK